MWYKRTNNDGSPKSIDKTKHKKNKDDILPDISFSRNSIFDTANKFNFFARINEDKKKDAEKRRSGYLPNISELDREAAEIIKKEQEALALENPRTPPPAPEQLMLRSQVFGLSNEENDEKRRSAKELISKFEATSVNVNRITINPAFIPRGELFGSPDAKDTKSKFNFNLKDEIKLNETPKVESKLPVAMKSSFNESLLGMWNCPHCTLENPNWKIICEACQKIKPYDKRYDPKSHNSSPISPTPAPRMICTPSAFNSPSKIPKASDVLSEKTSDEWDKKTERVLKYFSPTKPTSLSKSASETSVAKGLSLSKIPSPNLGFRKNLRLVSFYFFPHNFIKIL